MNKSIAGLLIGLVVALLAAEGKIAPLWQGITTKTAADPLPAAGDAGSGPPAASQPAASIPQAAPGFTLFPIPIPGSNAAFDSVRDNWPAGASAEWEAFKACYQAHGSISDCATLRAGSKG